MFEISHLRYQNKGFKSMLPEIGIRPRYVAISCTLPFISNQKKIEENPWTKYTITYDHSFQDDGFFNGTKISKEAMLA